MSMEMVMQTNDITLEKKASVKRAAPLKWMKECASEHELNSEVVLICDIDGCGKIYNDVETLRRHYRIHAERRHVCHYQGCGKKFMESTKLRRHMRIHTGEKPCVCTHEGCGKAFGLPYNLKIHMRIHSQENYHICQDCGKRYAFDYKLQSHILARHMNADNPMMKQAKIYPFVCPYKKCGKAYVYEYKLSLHLRRHHPLHNMEPDSGIEEDMGEGSDEVNTYQRKESNRENVSKRPSLKIILRTSSNVSHANTNIVAQQWYGKDVHNSVENGEDMEEIHERDDNIKEDGQE